MSLRSFGLEILKLAAITGWIVLVASVVHERQSVVAPTVRAVR